MQNQTCSTHKTISDAVESSTVGDTRTACFVPNLANPCSISRVCRSLCSVCLNYVLGIHLGPVINYKLSMVPRYVSVVWRKDDGVIAVWSPPFLRHVSLCVVGIPQN